MLHTCDHLIPGGQANDVKEHKEVLVQVLHVEDIDTYFVVELTRAWRPGLIVHNRFLFFVT